MSLEFGQKGVQLSLPNQPAPQNGGVSIPNNSGKTPYQQNLSQPVQFNMNNGIPSTQQVYSKIWEISRTDPEMAKQKTAEFLQMQNDPSSPYYNPYRNVTNRSVENLAAYGIDTSNIDDNWFRETADFANYLKYDGTTNSPTTPGKKASATEKAAYEWHQIGKQHELTKKAKSEWAALQDEIEFWTMNSGRNYSDDEVVEKIYGKNGEKFSKKYPTLAKMDDSLKPGGALLELNSPIGYSKDNVYTTIWRARNGGGTGDWDIDALLNASGKYNHYVEDPDITARLNIHDESTYAPYTVGSTMDDACAYYGMPNFTTEEIANMKPDGSDATESRIWNSLYDADQFTVKAEDEAAKFWKALDRKLEGETDPSTVMEWVDNRLGDTYQTLKELDDSTKRVNGLKDTTRAINYSYNDVLRKVQERCAENRTAPTPVEKTAEAVAEPPREGEQASAPLTPQEVETAKVKDKNIRDGRETGAGSFTPAEEVVMNKAGSSMWDYMRGLYTDAMNRMDAGRKIVQNNIDDTSKGYVKDYLQTARAVGIYNTTSDNYEKDQAELLKFQKKYGDLEDYYDEVTDHKAVQMDDGTSVYMHLDKNSNSYILDSIGMMVPEELELYDEGSHERELLREAERMVKHESDRVPKIQMAQNMRKWGGEELEQELKRYGQVNVRVEFEKKYLKEHDDEYNEGLKTLDRAEKEMAIIGMASAFLGADTSGLENARGMTEYLCGFIDEPPLPRSNETKLQAIRGALELTGQEATNEDVSNAIANGKQQVQDEMKLIEDTLAYVDEQGIEIPDSVRKHMQFMLEDYQKELDGFDYASILVDVDPAEVDRAVEAGRAFEEKYGEGNMHYWTGLFNENGDFYTLKYQQRYTDPEGETYRDIVSEEDEKTYYYLLGKKVLEMGGDLDDAIGRINVDPDGARAAVHDVFSDAKEYQRFMEDEVWSVREYDASVAYGKELAENSPVLANVAATLVTPGESIASILEIIDTAVTGRRFNSKSMAARFTGAKNVIREETRAAIDEVFKDKPVAAKLANIGYEIYCNRGDSMMNTLAFGWMFGGVGGMAEEFLSAMPMGASAALAAAAEAIENGASTEQAWLIAGATFFAETATEAVTFSNIQEALGTSKELTAETVKDIFKEWLTKDGLEEVLGEVSANIIERAASKWAERMDPDGTYASDHQRLVDQYIAEGKTPDEAETLAKGDELKDDLHTAIVSYLSAGTDVFVKTGKAALNSANYYRTATRAAQQIGDSRSMVRHMLDDHKANKEAKAQQANQPGIKTTTTTTQGNQQAETGFESEDVELDLPDVEPAVAAEQQAEQQKQNEQRTQYAKDLEIATTAMKNGTTESVTAGISAILSMDQSETSMDMANAAAVRADTVFPGGIEEMRDLLKGGADGNVDNAAVKHGMIMAILGGEESESYQVVQSEAYQNATDAEKAQMLAQAGAADARNQGIQLAVSQTVQETRVAEATRNAIADGMLNNAREARAEAEKAAADARQAEEDLTVRQSETKAADDARVAATQNAVQNPGDLNAVKEKQQADAKVRSTVEVENEYQQRMQKAKEKKEEAERKAKQKLDEDMVAIRGQSQEAVAQTDQQRADAAAQQAEAQRIADEQQAQVQAEEDQRSGKTQEENENAAIDEYADQVHMDDKTRNALKERRAQQREGKIDLTKRLSDAESYLALGALSRKLNVPIKLSDTLGVANGKYENGIIYLNAKNAQTGQLRLGQALVEVAMHEVTHSLEKTKSYKQYRDLVIGQLFGFGDKFDAEKYQAAIDAKKELYRLKANHELRTDAEAEQEIVADFAKKHLNDREVIQRFMDAGMGGKMRNILHNINQALKNFYAQLRGEDRKEAEYLRRTERAFQKALEEKAKTDVHPTRDALSVPQFVQSMDLQFDENELAVYKYVYDKNGNRVKDENGNYLKGEQVTEVTPDMISGTPVGMLIDTALSGTNKKGEDNRVAAKKMFADLMSLVLKYRQSDLVWEIAGSTLDSPFSALKANSDTQYLDTVDFGTICAKTQAIINVMSKFMMDRVERNKSLPESERKYGLTRSEVMDLYRITHESGLSVPCPVCYVFSRWLGVPSLLGKMSKFQHQFVALNEDGKTINREATEKNIQDYLKDLPNKEAVDAKEEQLIKELKSLEKERTKLEGDLANEKKPLTPAARKKAETRRDDVLRRMTEIDDEMEGIDSFNWVTQALCKQNEDGTYSFDEEYEYTPDEVLFDMNKTGEFAKYKKNWTYRTTRGSQMGKAILPYGGEQIGDIIGGTTRALGTLNNFLNKDKAAAMKDIISARERAIRQNLVGGQRLQSTSDYRPEWGLDYVMAFLELQAMESSAQMYTKVAEAVDFFANVGADVNLSIMGEGSGYHIATEAEIEQAKTDEELASRMGVTRDENGEEHTYVLDFSSTTGMDYNTAKGKSKKYNNVQMILVGMNDIHVRLAMANKDIDFIIPWHSSGNSKSTIQTLVASVGEKLDDSSDFSFTQSDKKLTKKVRGEDGKLKSADNRSPEQVNAWNARLKILTGKAETLTDAEMLSVFGNETTQRNEYLYNLYQRFYGKNEDGSWIDPECGGVKMLTAQAKQIFPYEYWDTNSTRENANENGHRFIDYCWSLGVVPRFSGKQLTKGNGKKRRIIGERSNFAGAIFDNDGNIIGYDPNKMADGYWKLLIDRKMYDNDTTDEAGAVTERGKYRKQQKINVTDASVGYLSDEVNEQGKRKVKYRDENGIEQDAMLANSTSAKYGQNYSDKEKKAVDRANSEIDHAFDLKSEPVPGDTTKESQLDVDAITDAEMDDMLRQIGLDYDGAVARNDMNAAQKDVEFFAERRGFDTDNKAYHGTDFFGFTEFDLEEGQGTIFVSYDKDLAATYSRADDTKAIYNANLDTADDQTLIDLFKGANERAGQEIADVTVNEDGDFVVDFGDGTETYSRDEIIDGLKNFDLDYAAQTGNMNAESYVADRLREGIYEMYTRPGNQLVIDGEGKPYGETPVPWSDKPMTTREIAEYAKANGYDSVRINNIVDRGHHWDKMALEGRDIGIFFRENDVKSADPVTKDSNGNVIPLNERFTDNKDLRYSIDDETDLTDAEMDEILRSTGISYDQMLEREGVVQGQSEEQGESNENQSMVDAINSNGWSVNEEYAGYEDYSRVKRVYDENNKVIGILYDDERITIEGGGEKYKRAEQKLQSAGFVKKGYSWYPGEKQQPSRNSAQQNQNKETIPGGEIIETDGGLPSVPSNLPGNPLQTGPFRQFGRQTAQGSDALHQQVRDYLYTHSDYDPETNQEQIGRAVDWVRSNASEGDEDGYRASLDEVLSPGFDYRSADGQARMLTVMGMAALKAESGDQSALNDELRLADAFNRQGTDLGRQLQARKIFRLMTPLGRRQVLLQEADRINTDFANRGKDTQVRLSDWTLKAAESAQSEQDFEKVRKTAEAELAAQIPANWKEKIQTWRMLSMLGNPRTHIRNIVGNAIFMPTVGLKNAIASVLENHYIKEGGERTKAIRYTEDAKAFAEQDVKTMKDVLTGEAKYSADNRIDRQKKAFGQGSGIISRTIGRFVQDVSDINSDLLEVEDWFFLNRHYQNALASYMTANGLKSEDMTGTTLEKARAYAVLEAQKATYRDANAISDILNKWSRAKGGIIVDAVLPFKKTPANILRRGIEYSPVGLIKSFATMKKSVDLYNSWEANGFKGEMPKGAKTMNQAIDSIAAGATGTMIAALGALGYALGAVKLGFGKKDDDELDQERGSQEYSIELFGLSVTVDWAAPVCMPFFLGASLFQNIAENDGNITLGSVVNSIMGISEPVFNLSMLDGVNSLLETTKYSTNKDSTPIGDLLQKIGANYVGSMFPALGGAWARSIDNTRRKNFIQSGDDMSIWTGMVEQVQNKIPGLSFYNIPYRNVWGEADVTPRGEAFLENFVLPGYINHMKEDKLVDELQRIYDQTGDKSVIPKAAGKTVGGIKLTDKEYDQYVVTRGQTAKRLLNELIERPEFIALTPTDVSAGNPEAQVQLIGQVWQYCNAIARHEVDPEYDIGSTGKWIAGAYARDDAIDTIFANEEAKAQKENANAARADLITAINGNDADAIGASVEALKRSGKTTKQIKDNLYDDFRDMYKEAYLNDDYETMDRIKYGMMYADLGDDSIGEKIFQTWAKDAEKKRNQ